MKTTQTPSIAIIGHGTIGAAHRKTLLEYQAAGKVGPIYSIDTNPAQLAGQDASLTAGSLEELTSRGVAVDVVLIAANTAMRQENYNQLLSYAAKLPIDARPSLFVEKPVADMNHDIELMQSDFKALGYGDKVPLAFAYLIRTSQAVRTAANYARNMLSHSRNLQVEVVWQKQRDVKRITPGVHIDETTHGIDAALYLLESAGCITTQQHPLSIVPVRNSALPVAQQNSFFNVAEQSRIYGTAHDPIATISYEIALGNKGRPNPDMIRGSSSFVTGPQRREIKMFNEEGFELVVEFDTKAGDVVHIPLEDEPIIYKQTSLMDSKIGREWGLMLDYHKTGDRHRSLCSLAEAVRDLRITKMLETPVSKK